MQPLRVALLIALIAFGWILLAGEGRHRAAALDRTPPVAAAPGAGARVELDGAPRDARRNSAARVAPPAAERAPGEARGERPPSGRDEADGVSLGSLRLAAVDGATAAHIRDMTLRTWPVHEGAGGAFTGASPLSIEHPVGHFEGGVFAPGYDPGSVPAFEVEEGGETDLGRVTLHRGGARLEGVVRAGPVAALRSLAVELHGAGRNPCGACAPEESGRCEACGFAASHSTVKAAPDQSFRFERLAAGRYDLVVKDADGRVVASRRIDLDPLEVRHVEVDLDLFDLPVETVDADGAPFDGWWLEGPEVFSATMRFHVWLDDVLVAAADVAPEKEIEIEAYVEATGATGQAVSRGDDVTPEHARFPEAFARPPSLSSAPSSAARLAPGRFRLEGVPRRATHVQVTVGPFITSHVALEKGRRPDEPVRIVVDRRCGFESKVLRTAAGTRCTSCHSLHELAGR